MTRSDWEVKVYDGAVMVDSWTIENRAEREAETEALHDVEREFPERVDWTMTRKEAKGK